MLCISRGLNEQIRLILPSGETIEIITDQIRAGKLCFKINAPKDVKIERDELKWANRAEAAPQPQRPRSIGEFRRNRKAMGAA